MSKLSSMIASASSRDKRKDFAYHQREAPMKEIDCFRFELSSKLTALPFSRPFRFFTCDLTRGLAVAADPHTPQSKAKRELGERRTICKVDYS